MLISMDDLIWSVSRMARIIKLKNTFDKNLSVYGKYDHRTLKSEWIYKKEFEKEYQKKKFLNEGF